MPCPPANLDPTAPQHPTDAPLATASDAGPPGPDAWCELQAAFEWRVPEHCNIADLCCRRWAELPDARERIAISSYLEGAQGYFYTYAELQARADMLSAHLHTLGVQPGQRVAIVLPQRFATAVAYIAVLQMGAVAMPLSMLFGPDALTYRLQNSQAVLALTDAQSHAVVQQVQADCPALQHVLVLDDHAPPGALTPPPASAWRVDTPADAAAVLIYTSGTTGNPKGALIAHRALVGNLSGFLCSQNGFGFDWPEGAAGTARLNQLCDPAHLPAGSNAVFWSPADWAWTGGLMDALLPTLFFGRRIVAYSGRFSAALALALLRDCAVTHTFLFPTALKAIMKTYPGSPGLPVRQQFELRLSAIMSAGEAVGDAVFVYCQQQLGVTVNEMFGQTEVNYVVGNCSARWPARPGSMGLGYPGHQVAVIDDEGQTCPVGQVGEVAVHRRSVRAQADPVFFLGYWGNEAATADKFSGDWCRTGDLALRDAQGYLWYQGRSDDVFKSAGYRIGPGEIENCLLKHPAVGNAAVVPKPDRERGAVVKAYVVLAPDYEAARAGTASATAQFDAELVAALQAHVKGLLAPYEYPKEIEFVPSLPMTTTGKVQRRVLRLQEQQRAAALAGPVA